MKRDYYYELTNRGVLILDGVVQDDPWFVDFFFRRLATNANPYSPEHPYVSRCGDEMNYLKPHDTPVVFIGFDGKRLLYAHSLSVVFDPTKLAYSKEGVLYHAAPIAGLGRCSPQVAVEIAKNIVQWGTMYAYKVPDNGQLLPLLPREDADEITIIRPKESNYCVGCGMANSWSLKLSFIYKHSSGIVSTFITPTEQMCGAMNTTHGGFVSLLLDETMGKSLSVRGIKAPTARLTVNFRQPMLIGSEYEIRSWIEHQSGRKNMLRAEILSASNNEIRIADAEALFITVKESGSE